MKAFDSESGRFILEDSGTVTERPRREDFATWLEWFHAVNAFDTRFTNHCNAEFADAFRKAMR